MSTTWVQRWAQLGVGLLLVAGIVQGAAAGRLEPQLWQVDGLERTALVRRPAARAGEPRCPLVFVFHGHGGSMHHAARTIALHTAWREAVVVYPQGLPTPGHLTDPHGERTGWQRHRGDQQDRDLRFVDVMLAALNRTGAIDPARIYATGHSNGGAFTYLLWAERRAAFAAFAPSAAVLVRGAAQLRPRPVLHLGSPSDSLVKFAWQSRMIDHVLRVNGVGPRAPDTLGYVAYPDRSGQGADVATFLHDGGHAFPSDGTIRIVQFFQAHRLAFAETPE